jgi:probable phosphoglycerate mutase
VTNLRLVLARHGETPSNLRMALDSAPPGPPLTEEGHRQAAELARSLATEPVVAVYASTAVRAQQTAEPVAAAHGLPVEVIDGVQEVFVGELDNRTDEESLRAFFTVFSRWAEGDLGVPMPGGESAEQVIERYHRVLRDVVRGRHSHGVVVVLSHGAAIRLVAPTLATNVSLSRVQHALLPNTGRVVLDDDPASPTGWRCLEWTGLTLD